MSSIAVVRGSGRFDEYVAQLSPEMREPLLEAVAGTWIPMNVALAHYVACDALAFSTEQAVANGRATFDRTSGTLLGTMIRMAREAGVTPWTVFPHFQRFWERGYDGGGVSVVKTGPKEARIELVQVPLLASRYYRGALRGLVTAVVELFCRRAFLAERAGPTHSGIALRAQWA